MEFKELKIYTCNLPFSYMGQTGLFLYAGIVKRIDKKAAPVENISV